MTMQAGQEQPRNGYYLNTKTFALRHADELGSRCGLDGRWMRIPTLVAIPAAPVLGGLFVVTLPFVGVAMAAYAIGKKVLPRRGSSSGDHDRGATTNADASGEQGADVRKKDVG